MVSVHVVARPLQMVAWFDWRHTMAGEGELLVLRGGYLSGTLPDGLGELQGLAELFSCSGSSR